MKFDIPFNSEIYLSQTQLIIPLVYKDYLKSVRESIIVGLISIILGVFIIIGKSNLGNVFIILGIGFLIKSLTKFNLYNKLKKTHLKLTKESLLKNESEFGNGVFEFTSQSLKYSTKSEIRDINWNEFEGFKIVKSNLLLILNQKNGEIVAIGKKEIGNEYFKKIVDFIKLKLK